MFVRGQFPVLGPYKHTAIHQTCCHPSSSGTSLFAHYFLSLSLSLSSPPISPHPVSATSQLSPVTLPNQTESSGLMRLLAVAFPGEKDKEEWEREQEEARRRDHRRIGTVRRNLDQERRKKSKWLK